MDAGSGLRTPFCRVSFAYFSRVLVTNVYYIVDNGTTDRQPYNAYLWNDRIGGKGPDEIISIFLHFIQTRRTGAKRLVIEADGCGGQVWNQYFFAVCGSLVDSTTDLCRCLGATRSRPIFERIDLGRGTPGHTFMHPDRVHAMTRNAVKSKPFVSSIDEYEDIIAKVDRGRIKVTNIKVGDGLFKDIKGYLQQSYKLGTPHADIDGKSIATQSRHWANFGFGPSGGPNSTITQHQYGAWRLRDGYEDKEPPCEIVVSKYVKPNRRQGVYVLQDESIRTVGAYQRSLKGFVKYNHRSWNTKWRHERPLTAEKVRDTHKLACLGLPMDKIKEWPCPDPDTCTLDRCPFRTRRVVAQYQV